MVALACGLLALGVAAFLITPLLEQQRRTAGPKTEVEDLLKKKEFLYAAIRELNIDFNMGKLSAEDHQHLQADYMREAAMVLDRLEQTNGKPSFGARIEQDVLALRQQRATERPKPPSVPSPSMTATTSPPGQPVEASPPEPVSMPAVPASAGETRTCHHCGAANEAAANFCVECGTALTQLVCTHCGKAYKPGSKFCSHCGQQL